MSGRWTGGVRREILPNGLTLLAQPVPGATAVASVCHVRAGFFDEPDPLTGVSHVLEHMLFKGTPTRGVGDIAREMKAAGGYLNAGTGYDHTAYYAVLPPESLAPALDLQADALRRSLIDPGELARELKVIIEEARRKLDTPAAVAGEQLHALLFDRHRIRRWRIGSEAQLAALTRDQVAGYYRSRYVPSRTIVALAGALDPDRALAAAAECFGGWPAAEPASDPSPEEPPRREVRASTLRGDVRHGDLILGWRTVGALHPDAAALDLAAMVLSAGRASWLYRALRAPGLATSAGASHYTPTEVGVFAIATELPPSRLAAALDEIGSTLARLRDPGPTPADLSRARTLLESRWARRLQTADGRAAALASAEALGGFTLLDREYEALLAVDAGAVRQVASEWLSPESCAGVAYLPERAPEELSVAALGSALARPALPGRSSAEPPAPRVPLPRPVSGSSTGAVLHVLLPGADLLLQEKPGVPLVSLGVYRRRTTPDQRNSAGLGALAVRSAARGAGDLDAGSLAVAFERLGGSLTPLLAADWFGYAATVLAARVGEGAALLDLVLRAPLLDAGEIARERATLAEEAAQAADDMLRYPMQLALHAAFGDSRYGLPAHGYPDSVPRLTEGMVRAWHACELAAGRTLVVAAGDLAPERLAEELAGIFSRHPPRQPSPPPAQEPWLGSGAATEGSLVERSKRQTALAVLFPGPSRREPARFAAQVWSAVASGLGGRLFLALRDRRSLAYSVFASSWQRGGAGALLLYLATAPEREAEARDALLAELAGFAGEPPAAGELAMAINYLSGQVAVERQTAGAVAAEIAEAWLSGTGLDELLDPAGDFRSVNARAVQELAVRSFEPTRRAEGIVRGR